MFKFYRGTTVGEADELSNDKQFNTFTFWTDVEERARQYSKGAVLEIVLDFLPPNFDHYRSTCHGDSIHGTFYQWVIPADYFNKTMSNFIEETHIV